LDHPVVPATLRSSAGNLPAELTSFVGRRRELTEAKALLPATRLLTISGMGGVGKTRFAHRLAADVSRAFPDGVWEVGLADLHEPALVAAGIADAIGLREPREVWTLGRLQERLASKHLLLLLDNCEHLVDACAVTADALLRGCPGVHILATSRQPLAIDGEQTLTLAPLPSPDPEQLEDLSRLVEFDATRLFLDRAAAALPGFALDQHNQRAVAELCQRLGGLPLALEFAALRVRALSPVEIVARLDQESRLSSRGSRLAPSRQQSLRALVDWSYQLCSEDERLLWRLLSVFAGAFDLDTVDAVCASTPLADNALDLLVGLVEKSVLTRDVRDGEARYRMAETIRDYGHEQLTKSGQEQAARSLHRDWFAAMVERAYREYAGPEQLNWFTRLREVQPDIRLALEHCVTEPGGTAAGADMLAGLLDYWLAFALLSEGRHWLERMLRETPEQGVARARLLRSVAYFSAFQGERTPQLEEARTAATEAGDAREVAWIAHAGSLAAASVGDYTTAMRLDEEAAIGMRVTDDLHGLLNVLSYQAVVACMSEEFAVADERASAFVTFARSLGESWVQSYVLWALGIAAHTAGDLQRATALELESLTLRLPFQDAMGLALCTEVLAWVAAAEQRDERAALLLGAAQQAAEAVGIDVRGYAFMVTQHDQVEEQLRARMGDTAFETSRRHGRDLRDAQVMALAGNRNRDDRPAVVRHAHVVKSPLTPREQQTAELVAEGLSDKQIAARLVVSPRTAEGHVERILVKLGFSSRAQIAAWVAERRA